MKLEIHIHVHNHNNEVEIALDRLEGKIMALDATTQGKLDALGTSLDAVGTTLGTALTGIQSDLDGLKAQGPNTAAFNAGLDAIQAKLAPLQQLADAFTALDAANPVAPAGGGEGGGGEQPEA